MNGQLVTPDSLASDYQATRATLELLHFRAECCLRGLPLNGQHTTPDEVANDYERGGWLLEMAIFVELISICPVK